MVLGRGVTGAVVFLIVAQAHGAIASECTPRDNAARILASPAPNDIHPDWRGESYIGLSWTFVPHGYAGDNTGRYLRGNLFSPRGGLVNADVYVFAKEWECK